MNITINYMGMAGAGQVLSYKWAEGFKQIGHQVYAILSDQVENKQQWIELIGENHIYFVKTYRDRDHKDFVLKTIWFTTIEKSNIRKKFRGIEMDVVLNVMYHHWSHIAASALSRKNVVSICHDPINHSGEKEYIKKLYVGYMKKSDQLIVLTKSFVAIARDRFQFPEEKIIYIPHGRMNVYETNSDYDWIAEKYKGKYHFLFFGRIEKYKGLHVLAEAYKLVCEQRDDVALTILGSGNFQEYKSEYAKLKNVFVENRFIHDEEIGNYFAVPKTISVIPYIDATQSGVIPIAFEYGTPIISSNQGGLKEQLNDGAIGLLYENNDPKLLADCMLELINNDEKFQEEKVKMERHLRTLEWDLLASEMIEELKRIQAFSVK